MPPATRWKKLRRLMDSDIAFLSIHVAVGPASRAGPECRCRAMDGVGGRSGEPSRPLLPVPLGSRHLPRVPLGSRHLPRVPLGSRHLLQSTYTKAAEFT